MRVSTMRILGTMLPNARQSSISAKTRRVSSLHRFEEHTGREPQFFIRACQKCNIRYFHRASSRVKQLGRRFGRPAMRLSTTATVHRCFRDWRLVEPQSRGAPAPARAASRSRYRRSTTPSGRAVASVAAAAVGRTIRSAEKNNSSDKRIDPTAQRPPLVCLRGYYWRQGLYCKWNYRRCEADPCR